MTALVYATSDDFKAFTEDTTAEVSTRLLKAASRVVRHATRFAVYDTDATGMPTDASIRAAFTEATCAQAEWSIEQGDLTGTGVVEQVSSASIGGVSFTLAPGSAATSTTDLCDAARLILADAGLLKPRVWVRG